jgi:hypothetical protein
MDNPMVFLLLGLIFLVMLAVQRKLFHIDVTLRAILRVLEEQKKE